MNRLRKILNQACGGALAIPVSKIITPKKVFFWFLWALVFYLVGCAVVGGIAGAFAGSVDAATAYEAGRTAGAEAVARFRLEIAQLSGALAAVGISKGHLPGARS
jgi:hypothetical protein